MSSVVSFLVCFLGSLAFAEAPGAVPAGGQPVLTVNGVVLTQEMIDVRLRSLDPQQVAQMKESGQYVEVLRSIALGELLYAEAIERGFHEDPKAAMVVAVESRDILASEYVERLASEAVTESAIQARYLADAEAYSAAEVRARHILVETAEEAAAVKAELAAGGDFAAIAAAKSIDTGSGGQGGDLGWFEPSMMVEPFALAVTNAPLGPIAEPVQTRFGFHLIEVTDRRDAIPLEDVREEIASALREEVVETLLSAKEARLDVQWANPEAPGEPGPAIAGEAAGGTSTKTKKKDKKKK